MESRMTAMPDRELTTPQNAARRGPDLADGPVLPTLIALSLPNVVAMTATTLLAVAETIYIGRLGSDALAGIAGVFPIIVLQQSLSNGAMGGGVSSAISRALGAGDETRAASMALHAVVIALVFGLATSAMVLYAGPALWRALGATGPGVEAATAYATVAFSGSILVWLTGLLISVLRGGGNMRAAARITLALLAVQILTGGLLGLGVGRWPGFGMAGVGAGLVIAYGSATVWLICHLISDRARVRLRVRGMALCRDQFADILSVGLMTCISPVQTVLTVVVTTYFVAQAGPAVLAGYGIGTRLEMVMIPLAFGIGVACLPMVGTAIGRGRVARAKRVAWTGAALSAAVVGGAGLMAAVFPGLWPSVFTSDPAISGVAGAYLTRSGPAYLFFGIGLCLLFASQGARRVGGPVLAGTMRLALVALGGWVLSRNDAPVEAFFWLAAAGMCLYGMIAAVATWRSDWTPGAAR